MEQHLELQIYTLVMTFGIWDSQGLTFNCHAACCSEQNLLLFTAALLTQKDLIALSIELDLSIVLNSVPASRSVLSDSSFLF